MSEWQDLIKPIVSPEPQLVPPPRTPLPTGTPGIEWDGTAGELRTGAMRSAPGTWDDLLVRWGLDPAEVEVVEPVRRSSWEQRSKDGEVMMLNSFRARLRRKRTGGPDIETLMTEIRDYVPKAAPADDGELAFVHCSGDLQAGKPGTAEMIGRFLQSLHDGPARLAALREQGVPIGPVYLPWLGDCIEHVSGSYPSQRFQVELSLTEQIRVIRRLMFKQIQAYAGLTTRLVVPVVPGNHDIAYREGGKDATHTSDSFAVEIASEMSEILSVNPEAYGHVSLVVPERDCLTVSLDVSGTAVGFAHGHQFRRADAMKWWAEQAHGMQQIGETTLLLSGHFHHLRVIEEGRKTWIQIPALDSGSPWYTNTTGRDSRPGVVTLVVGKGSWGHFSML